MAITFCLTAIAQKKVVNSKTTFARGALQPYVDRGELPGATSIFYNNGVQEVCCISYVNIEQKHSIRLSPFLCALAFRREELRNAFNNGQMGYYSCLSALQTHGVPFRLTRHAVSGDTARLICRCGTLCFRHPLAAVLRLTCRNG